jgi:hypothetical protein
MQALYTILGFHEKDVGRMVESKAVVECQNF